VDIAELCRGLDRARSERSTWDNTLQQIADRCWPVDNQFTTINSPGALRTEYMLDATAALAGQKAAAVIQAFVWPSNQRYQRITTDNDELNQSQAVKRYCDAVTDRLFRARYSPYAAFEAQMGSAALQFIFFGTASLLIDERKPSMGMPGGISYRALHLGGFWVRENSGGKVDTLWRCWSWTLRQIEQEFPGRLPDSLREKLKANPDMQVEVAHVVMPRTDYDPRRVDHSANPWYSCYFLPAQKHKLDSGGYAAWPFGTMRYMTSPGEVYGRSPAWMALSNIRVLNTMKETVLDAAQKQAEPPLLLPDDGLISEFSMAPGYLNYGGVQGGKPQVFPLETGANTGLGLEMMDKEREIIASNFFLDVFRALVENPQMTATQALELMQERATLLAPIVGRIESEFFAPMTMRELQLLEQAGALPPQPPEMLEAVGEFKLEYTSPARKAMRASEGIAITRTLESIIPMAQVDQTVLDAYDLPEMARELGEINGLPAKCLRDAKDIAALKEQRANEQEAAQLMQAAPVISETAKNLVQLQQSRGVPQV
jgi:hypothetical protein